VACACGKETCGCSAPELVYLLDELGETHTLVITERLTVHNQEYVFAVHPEDNEVVALLKVHQNFDGSLAYLNITDDAEWAELEASLGVQ
jgi:Protein of unknown function (DUF1292)